MVLRKRLSASSIDLGVLNGFTILSFPNFWLPNLCAPPRPPLGRSNGGRGGTSSLGMSGSLGFVISGVGCFNFSGVG